MSVTVIVAVAVAVVAAAIVVAVAVLLRCEPDRPYRDEACDVCSAIIGREPYHTIVAVDPLADALPGVESGVAASRHARCCPGDCVQRDRHAPRS
jgi:hypothetical protein